jgi:hypothetical protein
LIEKSDEAFSQKTKTQKNKISSRIRRFIRREAIQLKAKFALGYSRQKNSLNGYF